MGTQSLQYGLAMELLLERVYPETTMIIGRWYRNNFLWCIRIKVRDLSKGISDFMVTIPEAEVIYFTLGQPRV